MNKSLVLNSNELLICDVDGRQEMFLIQVENNNSFKLINANSTKFPTVIRAVIAQNATNDTSNRK